MGFLKDPRRTCVALTRAKFLLLIIANDALGADQCCTRGSSSWWGNYRALLAGLGKTHHLQRLDMQGCYEIINALKQAPRKSRDDVSACMNIGGFGDFFKNYQRKWIGVLDGLCEVLQSDAEDESDAEAGVSSCGSSDTGQVESGLDVTLQKKFQSTIGIWKQSPAQYPALVTAAWCPSLVSAACHLEEKSR